MEAVKLTHCYEVLENWSLVGCVLCDEVLVFIISVNESSVLDALLGYMNVLKASVTLAAYSHFPSNDRDECLLI